MVRGVVAPEVPADASNSNEGTRLVDDAERFREIYDSVRRVAAVVGDRSEDPDDLVQEALTRALSAGGLTRLENPEAYLKRVVINVALNEQRSRFRRQRRHRHVVAGESLSDHAEYPSDLSDLMSLKAEDRLILYLADIDGESYASIAAVTGRKESTMRGRASRARKQLAALILEEGKERR